MLYSFAGDINAHMGNDDDTSGGVIGRNWHLLESFKQSTREAEDIEPELTIFFFSIVVAIPTLWSKGLWCLLVLFPKASGRYQK